MKKNPSRTAAYTCVSRASSYYEKSPHYKSNDNIAPKLLPKFIHLLIKSKRIRKFIMKKLAPKGIYEYVIARTKFIDDVFLNALSNHFDQILLFGAGFDSRGVRFNDENEKTRVFELDVHTTIDDKLKQYKKRKINPGKIHYIEIDFDSDMIQEKLKMFGFQYNKKTLYIMEGITMYLTESAINEDFKFILESAGPESQMVFDFIYKSVLDKKNLYYGEREIYENVKKAGEGWTFGILREGIQEFLQQKGLEMIELMDSDELEKRYFQDDNGKIVGKINGTHRIVYARKGNDS